MSGDYLSGLNQEQRRAVVYGITTGSAKACGRLLVIAGAGTGKPKTLPVSRILIVNGNMRCGTMPLTFSRSARLIFGHCSSCNKLVFGAAVRVAVQVNHFLWLLFAKLQGAKIHRGW